MNKVFDMENFKTCSICNTIRSLVEFIHKYKKHTMQHCWECEKIKKKESDRRSYEKHKEIRLKKNKENWYKKKHLYRKRRKIWENKNEEHLKKYKSEWYQKNKEKIKKQKYEKIDKVREWHRNRHNERNQTDLNYRIACALRKRVSAHLRFVISGNKAGSHIEELGCSLQDLKVYLESKFQTGMSWANWSRSGWHIDHIIPLSSFDLTNLDQCKKAFHYTNLQPLWAKENMSKGAKIL